MHRHLSAVLLIFIILIIFSIFVYSNGTAANFQSVPTSIEVNRQTNNPRLIDSTQSPTPTPSSTPSPSPTITLSPTPSFLPADIHLPVVLKAVQPTATPTPTITPTPTHLPEDQLVKILICNQQNQDIPDDDPGGVTSLISIDDPRFITDLDVRLEIDHSWIGDLTVSFTHQETGKVISLIDRPGYPNDSLGCKLPNIVGILDDDITLPAESECSTWPAAISGIYLPVENLNRFDGDTAAGNWLITIADHSQYDTGKLDSWCFYATVNDYPVQPTPTPTVDPLPESAIISGVTGQRQSLPLDCESRSAVDWANYFGVSIGEIDFFENLPESDNPDLGFVGSVYGQWGQIPPDPYGVHAEPVADLLRDYGMNAYAHRPFSWDQLRAEIAQNRPVIAWIVGNYDGSYDYVVNGIPEFYNPTEGYPMVVASYEHTIIVTGYTSEKVYYLNGANIYQKDIKQFLESWSTLGNMVITIQP